MRDIGHADFALLLSASRVPTRGERLDNSHSGRWVLCSSTGTSGFRSRGSDESASSLRIRIPARKPSLLIRPRVDPVRPVLEVKRSYPLQRPPFSSKFRFYNPKATRANCRKFPPEERSP